MRNCDQIKGICVLDAECKISQYADDTTLILDGSEKSSHQSRAMRFQRRKIAAYKNISWPSHKVKALESGYLPSKKNL